MASTIGYCPEYYQQLEDNLNVLGITQRVYKVGSEDILGLVNKFWYQYCHFIKKNPVSTLEGISINVLYAFFHWLLRERKDSLGAANSLKTYWNDLCLVRQRLANAHDIRKDKKKKPVLLAEDEFELLKTLYTSTETTFLTSETHTAGFDYSTCRDHGQPAFYSVGEQPRVLIEIVFNITKGYLGEKDANEFGIPNVPVKPCLPICPHITILALLFADQAFAASSLTSPEQLFCLRIAPGQKQSPVPLKEEMAERPLFRRCQNAASGVQNSEEEALTDTTLRRQMTALGSITGIELPTGPYTFRRGNGQAL
ncbi:hypothetical protein MMC21_002946 [Puttea exsequens]|nr:hypothetical protein [Puttea exsequens]